MKAEKIYRRILITLFLITLWGIAVLSYYYINISQIPDSVSVFQGREEILSFLPDSWFFPVSGRLLVQEPEQTDALPERGIQEIADESITVSHYTGTEKLPADLLHINLSGEVAIEAKQQGNYQLEISCFGILLKTVDLQVLEEEEVIPCGNIVGIYGQTDGVLVLGTGEITDIHGKKCEPAYNIVRTGDYIVEADGEEVENKEELLSLVKSCHGENIRLTLRRKEKLITVDLKPVCTADEGYRLGIWVRNDTQGIGTLTFVTEDGEFGALGHAITDIDTGEVLRLADAGLYHAEIASITKGEKGTPGEIAGIIHLNEEYRYGSITGNTSRGIFGNLLIGLGEELADDRIPVALRQEVTVGEAEIYCQLDEEVRTYKVEIEKIDKNPDVSTKGLIIRIVDEELLKQTNGIIQGMSGSPILQNGRIVGAVTHVLVNDPTRGYGIFIENMLEHN